MGGLKEFLDELESKKGNEKPDKGESVVDESNESGDEVNDETPEKFGDFMKKNKKQSGFAIFITSLGR